MKTVSCEDMIKRIEKYLVTNGLKLKRIYYIEWVSQETWDSLLQYNYIKVFWKRIVGCWRF